MLLHTNLHCQFAPRPKCLFLGFVCLFLFSWGEGGGGFWACHDFNIYQKISGTGMRLKTFREILWCDKHFRDQCRSLVYGGKSWISILCVLSQSALQGSTRPKSLHQSYLFAPLHSNNPSHIEQIHVWSINDSTTAISKIQNMPIAQAPNHTNVIFLA